MIRFVHSLIALITLALALNPAAMAVSASDEGATLICKFSDAPLSAEAEASIAYLSQLLDQSEPPSEDHENCAIACTAHVKAWIGPDLHGPLFSLNETDILDRGIEADRLDVGVERYTTHPRAPPKIA